MGVTGLCVIVWAASSFVIFSAFATATATIAAMLRAAVVACLLAFVAAQDGHHDHHHPSWFDIVANGLNGLDDTIDQVHQYRIEYHHNDNTTHLMIAINDFIRPRDCHIVEIAPEWEPLLLDPVKVQQISEEIYHLIRGNNVPETTLTDDQLIAKYGDNEVLTECRRHITKVMAYTPSPSIQG